MDGQGTAFRWFACIRFDSANSPGWCGERTSSSSYDMAALGIALIFLFIVASTYLIIMPSRLVRFINFLRLREVYNDYRRNGGGHDNFKNLYELSDGVAQKLLRGYEKKLRGKYSFGK
jgi:hypothetical protein